VLRILSITSNLAGFLVCSLLYEFNFHTTISRLLFFKLSGNFPLKLKIPQKLSLTTVEMPPTRETTLALSVLQNQVP